MEEKTETSSTAESIVITADAEKAAVDNERARIRAIQEEFADDPQFAMTACTEGWSIEQAKGEYCGVLKARLAEQPKAVAPIDGHSPIETDGSDGVDTGGDFITEAKALAEEKKISMTEAMKRLRRQKPQLHATFVQRSQAEGHQMYAMAR